MSIEIKSGHFQGTSRWLEIGGSKRKHGGNSTVYMVRQEGDSSGQFALKLFDREVNSASRRQRFEREIQIVQELRGVQGCAEFIDHGTHEGKPFYVMPYYTGGSFYDSFMRGSRPDVLNVLDLFLETTRIVERLHKKTPKLAIRDIKPQNILLDTKEQPILCDFGLSLWSSTPDEERLTSSQGVGSSGYRPPEWDSAYPDTDQTAGDVWSLGRTLWAVLSGHQPPTNYESLSTTDLHLKKFLPEMIANAVQGIVNQATRFSARERPSATELIEEIQTVKEYCQAERAGTTANGLADALKAISIELGGSEVVANSTQRAQELQSKFDEIDQAQEIILKKLRSYLEIIEKAIPSEAGKVCVFGKSRDSSEEKRTASAYIVFFPADHLRSTKMAQEFRYEYQFALNSSNQFAWYESLIIPEGEIGPILLNPRSIATMAAKKAGQIESILEEKFFQRLRQMLR